MYGLLNLLFSIILLLGNQCGGGDDDPEPPKYQEDPYTTQMKASLANKTQQWMDIPYESLVDRFSPSAATEGLFSNVKGKYASLFDEQDYGIEDYSKIENEYLDTVLGKYKSSREEGGDAIKESLIAENLYGSGPGYGIMSDYSEETAQGVGDISKQWAYEGIQRKQQAQQYQDALKRGDYATMYSLALSEQQREILPQEQATQTEMGYAGQGMGLFGQLNQTDLGKYNAAMDAYKASMMQPKKDMGGLGSALGMGAGLLLAAPTGGMSMLAGGMLGGAAGGGVGSMIQY